MPYVYALHVCLTCMSYTYGTCIGVRLPGSSTGALARVQGNPVSVDTERQRECNMYIHIYGRIYLYIHIRIYTYVVSDIS